MRRRQRVPHQWLVVRSATDLGPLRRLRRDTGVLLLEPLPAADMLRLRLSGATFAEERSGGAARVHDLRELRRSLLAGTPLILLSPIFPTGSHPEWMPMPRMRAAALARLGGRKLIALGGMDSRKFARIRGLGFQGWAGVSAFRT